MAEGPRLTPRKAPRQGRSRDTVDTLLAAAARVVLAEGVESATTNRIAEVAGVSVGSLYQYFPTKESIVTALFAQGRAEKLATLERALEAAATASPAAASLAIARAILDAYANNAALERILWDVAPRIGAGRKVVDVDKRMTQVVAAFFARHHPPCAEHVRVRRAFLVARGIDAAVRGAVLEHPEWLGEKDLAEDVAALVKGLLFT